MYRIPRLRRRQFILYNWVADRVKTLIISCTLELNAFHVFAEYPHLLFSKHGHAKLAGSSVNYRAVRQIDWSEQQDSGFREYIAHLAMLRALSLQIKDYKFTHGVRYALPNGIMLYDSYHCSRYNTQTKRLNEAMFHAIFRAIVLYLHSLDLNNSLDPNNRVWS